MFGFGGAKPDGQTINHIGVRPSVGQEKRSIRNTAIVLGLTFMALVSSACVKASAGGPGPTIEPTSTPTATAPVNEKSAVAGAFDAKTRNINVSGNTVPVEDTGVPIEKAQGDSGVTSKETEGLMAVPQPTQGEPTPPEKPVDADEVSLPEESLNGIGGAPESVDDSQIDNGQVVDADMDEGLNSAIGDENVYVFEVDNKNITVDLGDSGLHIINPVLLSEALSASIPEEFAGMELKISLSSGGVHALNSEAGEAALNNAIQEMGGDLENVIARDYITDGVVSSVFVDDKGNYKAVIILWEGHPAGKYQELATLGLVSIRLLAVSHVNGTVSLGSSLMGQPAYYEPFDLEAITNTVYETGVDGKIRPISTVFSE